MNIIIRGSSNKGWSVFKGAQLMGAGLSYDEAMRMVDKLEYKVPMPKSKDS